MRHNKLALYVHLVWTTWDRQPLLLDAIARRVSRVIEGEARMLGCDVLALNGLADHVHLLAKIPSTIAIASLVKQVKGVSSHFYNDALLPDRRFQWQGNYGAFTVSRWDVETVIEYIKEQQQRHSTNLLMPEFEETFILE